MGEGRVGDTSSISNFSRRLALFTIALMVICTSAGEYMGSKVTAAGLKGKLDACALLTAEDASGVLGDKVTKNGGFPRNMELQGGKILNSSCQYSAVSSDRTVGLNITYAPMNEDRYPKTLSEYRKLSAGGTGKPDDGSGAPIAVQGIGDFAVWSIQYGVGGLTVYWKGYKVIVTMGSYTKGGSESDREPAETAAKKVLGKL